MSPSSPVGNRLDHLDHVEASDRAAWRSWLEQNHASSPGVWLVYHKKGSPRPSVSYDEAVEEALCFGWIDSKVNAIDETCYKQVFTARKPRSVWSRPNKLRVERMIAEGRMTDAGLVVIEAAKRDGSWTILDEVDALVVPDDLAAAFATHPGARRAYDALNDSARKQVLYRLVSAKRPETRAARLERIVEELDGPHA